MIPKSILENTDIQIDNSIQTSRTFKVTSNKIQGYIDNLEALKQSIYHRLSTEKYEYQILSFDYGLQTDDLLGKDSTYVKIELKRRIKECLLKDERITNVDNFQFDIKGDSLHYIFAVSSIYGQFEMNRQVSI